MARTYQGSYRAVAKADPDGVPFIVFELEEGEAIPELKHDSIGVHLRAGATMDEARELAHAINQKMSALFLTRY